MSDINNLIAKLSELSVRQQRIIEDIVDEISNQDENQTQRGAQIAPNQGVRLLPRQPNYKFVSKNCIPLAIGDHVEILTTRRVGRNGDLAEVEVFNKLYVGVRIISSGVPTQRASKYLRYIE